MSQEPRHLPGKVAAWSEVVEGLWDEDRATGVRVQPSLLGSSALLVQRGLTESLAGRLFLHRCTHWSWTESQEAFGWDLDRWICVGGYPGAAPLTDDEPDWRRHLDSLIETVLARDVLQRQPITKPTLLRHLFGLAAQFPAQNFSCTTMLGRLSDAGNTVTLVNSLRPMETAFLVSGLELFSRDRAPKRGSSPKPILWNNARVNALFSRAYAEPLRDEALWGRLVENAVGAHLLDGLTNLDGRITYWRDGPAEADFVVSHGTRYFAVEVKSGRHSRLSGLESFRRRYPKAVTILIGSDGIPLPEFFSREPTVWFR